MLDVGVELAPGVGVGVELLLLFDPLFSTAYAPTAAATTTIATTIKAIKPFFRERFEGGGGGGGEVEALTAAICMDFLIFTPIQIESIQL